MPDLITDRETIEYTVQVPQNDFEAEHLYGDTFRDAPEVKSLHKEEISRHHEPDYVLSLDPKREVHLLLVDGVEVFAHRSHDAVVAKYRALTGATHHFDLFNDLDNPDLSWQNPPTPVLP